MTIDARRIAAALGVAVLASCGSTDTSRLADHVQERRPAPLPGMARQPLDLKNYRTDVRHRAEAEEDRKKYERMKSRRDNPFGGRPPIEAPPARVRPGS